MRVEMEREPARSRPGPRGGGKGRIACSERARIGQSIRSVHVGDSDPRVPAFFGISLKLVVRGRLGRAPIDIPAPAGPGLKWRARAEGPDQGLRLVPPPARAR